MKSLRRTLELSCSTALLVTGLAGCHSPDDDDPAAAAETLVKALAAREVQLVYPEAREEKPSVQLVGEIRAFDTVQVSSEVAGKVDRVLVEVGDRVSKGAPLAEVDRTTFGIYLEQGKANLAAANAELALAGKELERKRDLRSDETISQAAFDQAQAGHDLATARTAAAEASLSLSQRNFDRSIVRAPAAGAITQRHVVAGQWAEVGVSLLTLAIGNKVKVSARVPETWAPEFVGLETFTFTVGTGGPAQTARIYSIQPVVDQASRSFEIIGTAANGGAMRPGMFANVVLESPTAKRVLWLPASAIATSDLPQVLIVEDGVVAFRKIQIGRRDNGLIEIAGGLAEDEAVIADVSGLYRGIPVTVVE